MWIIGLNMMIFPTKIINLTVKHTQWDIKFFQIFETKKLSFPDTACESVFDFENKFEEKQCRKAKISNQDKKLLRLGRKCGASPIFRVQSN